jgi:hypothetical protein
MRQERVHSSVGPDRRGSAVVEFAVCLPLILLMVLGSIECCSMVFTQQSLTVCGYEGVRQAIKYDATNSEVLTRCNSLLAVKEVNGATVALTPADVSTVARGDLITVRISAPCGANSVFPDWFFGSRTLVASCTMVKE